MDPMPGMHDLEPLTWSSFWSSWQLAPGWLLAAALLAGGYAGLWIAGRGRSSVKRWRAASFALGCVLLWVCVASGIGGYAMAVFWMHMVLHLLLIMVVPALLVLGHPVTVLVEALPEDAAARARRVLGSRPAAVLTHPLTAVVVYGVVIVGTHLTDFMDQMTLHPWLMTGEQVLYVAAGFWFLMPLLGEEPVARNASYGLRLMVLLVAMVPDTVVGIVLLQTGHDLFPVMMGTHPSWAPDPVYDINVAGGLMWAGGDGLMMLIAVGLVLSVITSPGRRERVTGSWLDGVRRSVVADSSAPDVDPDSDEALDAYNRMLERLSHEKG
jgi:cytochrome c oxidase assembly factor CtaG